MEQEVKVSMRNFSWRKVFEHDHPGVWLVTQRSGSGSKRYNWHATDAGAMAQVSKWANRVEREERNAGAPVTVSKLTTLRAERRSNRWVFHSFNLTAQELLNNPPPTQKG